MDLKNRKPVLLAGGAEIPQPFTIAGDWPVWQNDGGPASGRLCVKRLDGALLAAAAH